MMDFLNPVILVLIGINVALFVYGKKSGRLSGNLYSGWTLKRLLIIIPISLAIVWVLYTVA